MHQVNKKLSTLLTGSLTIIPGLMLLVQCQQAVDKIEIILTNKSNTELKDKPIAIERSRFNDIPEDRTFPLIISSEGDTIPSQLDDLDQDGVWDELFFVVDLPGGNEKSYLLSWTMDKPVFQPKTSVRFGKRSDLDSPVQPATKEILPADEIYTSLGYQRYQTDGPSWENDKVGFRHYLDGRNSKDLFGKKVSAISPEEVGINDKGEVEDNYHVMEDWGRDILSVGNSVGIGGYGLLINDQPVRLGVTLEDSVNNVSETTFEILREGPVKSILKYDYANWTPLDRNYMVEETTTIWPGMYGFQNAVKISGLEGDEELAVGLVNINTEMELSLLDGNDKYVVLYTHDKQTYQKEWWLGLALIIPRDVFLGFTEAPKTGKLSNTFLARLSIENNKLIKYYAVACWELSDEGFREEEYFVNHLKDLTSQLSAEVEVTILQ